MTINPFLLKPIRAQITATGEPIGILQVIPTVTGPVFTIEYSNGKWGQAKWADFNVFHGDCERFAELIVSAS